MARQPLRLLIADDNAMVRLALVSVFQLYDDFDVIAEAEDGQEALTLTAQHQPDIVLMDLRMPRLDGIAATRHIHQNFPLIQIVVLTSSVEPQELDAVRDAGAWAVLVKHGHMGQLVDTLRRSEKYQERRSEMDSRETKPDLMSAYLAHSHLLEQRMGCLEKRKDLYQQLEQLRQEEKAAFDWLQRAYALQGLNAQLDAYSREIVYHYRNQHRKIFRELEAVRFKLEDLTAEANKLTPPLALVTMPAATGLTQ